MSIVRNILAFGSCSAHEPVYDLDTKGAAAAVWRRIQAAHTLYSHTPGEFIQLTRFLRGELDIDHAVRKFVFIDPDYEPSIEAKLAVDAAEIALVEVCTCESIKLGDVFLHRNEIPRVLLEPLFEIYPEGEANKAGRNWFDALLAGDVAKQRDAADFLRPRLPVELSDDATLAVLFEARLVAEGRDRLFASLEQFLELLGKPVGFLVHYRRYMPDGRPLSWPPMFRSNLLEFARIREIPVLDPQTIVSKHGAGKALNDDFVHYRDDFIPTVAEEYGAFIAEIERRYELDKAPSLSHTADEINRSLISLHRVRIRELGVDGSGLFAHYAKRLKGNEIVSRHEIEIFEVAQHCWSLGKCHVLRAGIGELAFLLAESGREVIAFDPEQVRLEALTAGLRHLAAARGWEPRRLVARIGKVPDLREQRGACCIAVHALLSDSVDDAGIVAQFAGYEAILFEPRTLFRLREDSAEQEALIDRFRAGGFVRVTRFPAAGLVYCAKAPSTARPSWWSELRWRLTRAKPAGSKQETTA